MAEYKASYEKEISEPISDAVKKRNEVLAKEVYLSVGRFKSRQRNKLIKGLLAALEEAMKLGTDLMDEEIRSEVFDDVAFRVRYLDETADKLHGTCA